MKLNLDQNLEKYAFFTFFDFSSKSDFQSTLEPLNLSYRSDIDLKLWHLIRNLFKIPKNKFINQNINFHFFPISTSGPTVTPLQLSTKEYAWYVVSQRINDSIYGQVGVGIGCTTSIALKWKTLGKLPFLVTKNVLKLKGHKSSKM